MPDYTNRTVLIDTKRERTADFLMRRRAEGVTDAVNMDGGGSSTLVVFDETTGKPRTLNRPSDRTGRRNALNVGIFFKSAAY